MSASLRREKLMQLVVYGMSALVALCLAAMPAHAVRLKDIGTFSGVRSNQLVGYGLVVGLSGTGDKSGSQFTIQSMYNMLDRMGVAVNKAQLKPKNTAAVMVTAKMPVSAKAGTQLDVTVSSIGDASSLLGGVLLLSPLKGLDGNVYAVAQGSLTIGGFSAEGAAATATKNVTTVGRIPNGAIIERSVPFNFQHQGTLSLNLSTADFSTTKQVVDALNRVMGGKYAQAKDVSTVGIDIPDNFRNNLVPLIATLENLEITPDGRAKVVVDEKTGTIVVGQNVRLAKVAVAHGSLQIVVQETPQVSQPGPLSQGQTVVTPQTNLKVREEQQKLVLLEGASIQELVDGLNAIGATPRDLISILRSLKAAGGLYADLEVI